MMPGASLVGLCAELSRIQVNLLQRRGVPFLLAREGVQLLREQLPRLEPLSSASSQFFSLVPKLLRVSATVLRFVSDEDVLPALDALDLCAALTKKYSEGGHVDNCINLNELSSLLRSISSLDDCQTRLLELSESSAQTTSDGSPTSKFLTSVAPADRFDSFLSPVYRHAMHLWSLPREMPTALSVLSLLAATSRLYGNGFHFPPVGADKYGLLPAKTKIRMEAKMQRCFGARGLLTSLREAQLNRTDAGMCLATMAQTGLYDPEVCNRSCDVLFAQHALLSSQQLCQVMFHLGTLQHRHIRQKFFSSLIEAENCNAEAVRQHVLGLAMLHQPPPSETRLMNGVFLHALRASHAHRRQHGGRHEFTGPSGSPAPDKCNAYRQNPSTHRTRRAIADPLNDNEHVLPPKWYIDVGHGLACLNIQAPKYKLMTARQTRRSIGRLTTSDRCRLLYALGGMSAEQVPPELHPVWHAKVEKSVHITAEKLKDIEPHEGPCVMNALLHCGIHHHPRIPLAPQLGSEDNPVEVLLRTWATVPKERVLELAERIRPQHISHAAQGGSSVLAKVATRVAATFGEASLEESHRLEPLCAAVEAHSVEMCANDLIRSLRAFLQMGRMGPRHHDAIRQLLANLWRLRYDMERNQLAQCRECVQLCTDLPDAMRLLDFVASH